MKLSGLNQGPPGIIMMIPRVLRQIEGQYNSKDERAKDDLLSSDKEMELNDESFERTLTEKDEELAARTPQERCRIP